MEYLTKLDGAVLGFSVRKHSIDALCGKKLLKIDKESGKILYEREIFEKEGLARIVVAEKEQIFISDFCSLSVFHWEDYSLLGNWQIGEDLSSDICGMTADENTIYCSIRNGRLVTVSRSSFGQSEYSVCDSSMWSLKAYGSHLLCGTVDGQLLLLEKETMMVEKRLLLGKQNIRSLFLDDEIVYAASQDKKIFKIDLSAFEIMDVKRNAHKKMFNCAGIYDDKLVTVSYPCSEIALWSKDTLEKRGEISVPLKLSGCAYVEGNKLYLASRNINGIGIIKLLQFTVNFV